MTITFGNTQISLEDGNVAAPQTSTPAPAKKGHGKAITGVLLLTGLGAAGYIAAGGASGIQGMVNGGSAAGKTVDAIGNINENVGNVSKAFNFDIITPIEKNDAKTKAIAMAQGAMAGRNAALNGGGKLIQKAAGAASLFNNSSRVKPGSEDLKSWLDKLKNSIEGAQQ